MLRNHTWWGKGFIPTCVYCQFLWHKYAHNVSWFQTTKRTDDNEDGVGRKGAQSALMSQGEVALAHHWILLYDCDSAHTVQLEYHQRGGNNRTSCMHTGIHSKCFFGDGGNQQGVYLFIFFNYSLYSILLCISLRCTVYWLDNHVLSTVVIPRFWARPALHCLLQNHRPCPPDCALTRASSHWWWSLLHDPDNILRCTMLSGQKQFFF